MGLIGIQISHLNILKTFISEKYMIEVELKFPVASLEEIRSHLQSLGAISEGVSVQADEYFNDPKRNYAKLDIAVRIRQSDDEFWLTFKGPNLDPAAKIRKEIEMPLNDALAAEQMRGVLAGMGLVSVAKVMKRREEFVGCDDLSSVHFCLDEVTEVGGFVELELVVESQEGVEPAKLKLIALADQLGLSGSTRTSYLEMLLESRESTLTDSPTGPRENQQE
ncbi:MAG: class IV adenylate cyclase [Planctomycetaceae bacterium]|nr:class IV adenylate cyclase [Planctomycetaceae bacterium]